MEIHTFEDVRNQMTLLDKEHKPAEGLALLQRAAVQFPERLRTISYCSMCFAGQLKDIPLALNLFREALSRGDWLPPSWLDNEDLQILHGVPEFEELKNESLRLQTEYQSGVKPELHLFYPDNPAQPYPLLFALHRNAKTAKATAEYWRSVTAQGWLLAVPQSSQMIGVDAFAWDDWTKAEHEMKDHYASIMRDNPVNPENVFMGGFSAGGGVAIWLAVSGIINARGFAVLAPYLRRNVDVLYPFLEQARARGLRGYIAVGEQDMICLDEARKYTELFHTHGIACHLEILPGLDHDYPPDFHLILEKALAFLL